MSRANVQVSARARESRPPTLLEHITADATELTEPSMEVLKQPTNLVTRAGRPIHPGRFTPAVADMLIDHGLLVRSSRLLVYAYRVCRPSLLDQLDAGVTATESNPSGATAALASHPPVRLDTIDAYAAIDREARAQLRYLAPGRKPETLADAIRKLAYLAADLDRTSLAELAHLVGRWRIMARCATGWETPAWRPAVPCICCEQTGTLRIRPNPMTAWCVNCHETWDASTIGILGAHVQALTDHRRTTARAHAASRPVTRTSGPMRGGRAGDPDLTGVPGHHRRPVT